MGRECAGLWFLADSLALVMGSGRMRGQKFELCFGCVHNGCCLVFGQAPEFNSLPQNPVLGSAGIVPMLSGFILCALRQAGCFGHAHFCIGLVVLVEPQASCGAGRAVWLRNYYSVCRFAICLLYAGAAGLPFLGGRKAGLAPALCHHRRLPVGIGAALFLLPIHRGLGWIASQHGGGEKYAPA